MRVGNPADSQLTMHLSAPSSQIPKLTICAGQGGHNPSATTKRKRNRFSAKIYSDISNKSIKGQCIKASILETGVYKYTALKIYKEHHKTKVVVTKALPHLKGESYKKETT